ncbi:hypothetical protein VST7929_00928 [Vibrio stylophorae]|uniref:Nitrous oxide-stimulated promoter family protein n=1 Tax=Vibrio stylophorae TaxID=659351 RepID=A0ABM8ZT38_9VIBR|nr:nitrous oxide-stimulated promoter family protein [Vibrio stylophorae]CAH0533075.1 hypothetical protein VST7929_00928 [Vibrio stylophorae]
MCVVNTDSARLRRERKTIDTMVRFYCHSLHRSGSLCPDCESHLAYAMARLDQCRLGDQKPTCGRCAVSCYQAANRLAIQHIIRWAMPRLAWRYPWLYLSAKWDEFSSSQSKYCGKGHATGMDKVSYKQGSVTR